jgi:hypothetical protein
VYSRCWTLFVEAQKASVKGKTGKADVAVNLIGKLYQIETAKANGLSISTRCLPDCRKRTAWR